MHAPVPHGGQQQALLTQFLVEIVSSDGRIQVAGDPLSHAAALRLPAAQLEDQKAAFTVQASDRTRSGSGTGLGLSIASALAAAHGGDITVDTAPGQGAVFRVRLPLATTSAAVSRDS